MADKYEPSENLEWSFLVQNNRTLWFAMETYNVLGTWNTKEASRQLSFHLASTSDPALALSSRAHLRMTLLKYLCNP